MSNEVEMTKDDVIEWDLVQRKFDMKWELIGKIVDEENIYRYINELGNISVLVPFKWVTFKVYDFIMEEVIDG